MERSSRITFRWNENLDVTDPVRGRKPRDPHYSKNVRLGGRVISPIVHVDWYNFVIRMYAHVFWTTAYGG
jgi:hypothetical protein